LIGQYCSHRRADLSYGRVENGGLRCLYHGWLFDRQGHCIEQPCEPPDRRFCEKCTTPPTRARSAPALSSPTWDGRTAAPTRLRTTSRASGHVLVSKFYHECNFFQANEGNLDPSHVSYLHRQANVPDNLKRTVTGTDGKLPLALYDADMAPRIDAEETDYGVRIFSLRDVDGRTFFRVTNFVFPNKATIPDDVRRRLQSLLACPHRRHAPLALRLRVSPQRAPWNRATSSAIEKSWTSSAPTTVPNAIGLNRYLQDREAMKTWSFSGMGADLQRA